MSRVTLPAFVFALVACILPAPVLAQGGLRLDTIPIATVDFFGLWTVPDTAARRALGIAPGAANPDSAASAAAVARVQALPGVRSAQLDPVCCTESGGIMLYVGVEEAGAPTLRFAPAPGGAARLPAEVVAAGEAFDLAFSEAIAHRDFAETDTAGHAIMHWPAAQEVQLGFIALAARYTTELRDVLRTSADSQQRALAAQVLAYMPDKTAVVPDLAAALSDPDERVRNDVTRALALIAMLAQRRPELGIRVPYAELVEMLDSPVWSDRNKAAFALAQLSASRDSVLLAVLRERSLPALVEMARWQNMGHAGMALMVLARVAGLPESEIFDAFQRNDRAPILAAVERIAGRVR